MTETLYVVLFLLAQAGLAFVVGFSGITFPFRVWLMGKGRLGAFLVELLQCAGCFGFWSGAGAALVMGAPVALLRWRPAEWVVWGFIVAASNLLFVSIAGLTHAVPVDAAAPDDV